nr:hypothetical protein HAGR004_15110 [Bdellovibrio sp. HAGR004]
MKLQPNFDLTRITSLSQQYRKALPFNYCVIDNFFSYDFAKSLENEFPDYENPKWHVYKNQIEDKKTLNNWNDFGIETYKAFGYLCSPDFTDALSQMSGVKLYSDMGLHGGGWHIHASGGNLNPHLDYSLHPKMKLQRKMNIIIYLSEPLKKEHGGQLSLYSHDNATSRHGNLIEEIDPIFNRAVIFDTTQNSWHGMSQRLTSPQGIYRKSLAVYYLCDPPENVDTRDRALFAPRSEQLNDEEVLELIKKRANSSTASTVYRK